MWVLRRNTQLSLSGGVRAIRPVTCCFSGNRVKTRRNTLNSCQEGLGCQASVFYTARRKAKAVDGYKENKRGRAHIWLGEGGAAEYSGFKLESSTLWSFNLENRTTVANPVRFLEQPAWLRP